MPTDWELLDRYACAKDQSAFAELVARHIDFVYNSARRMLGGRDAEDVVQAVFFLLAQKSGKIPRQGALAGWLFRATRYCCANVKTQERRRRLREQGAAKHRPESTDRGATMSEDLAKFLDDALARLGEKERQAILVRYMEGKTAAETGAVLGVSAEAVEKRLERGIGKLRVFLSRKGFVAPAAILAGAMMTESTKAAPLGLAANVSAATSGMSAAAASIAKGAAAMMKVALAKIAAVVVCTLLILGITAGGIVKLTARADGPGVPVTPQAAPTPAPATQDPNTLGLPANDPKKLFMETIHELEAAKHLMLEATRDERTFAADEVTNAEHQAAVNSISSRVESISMERPDKLQFLYSGTTTAKDEVIYTFLTLFDHSSVLVASHHGEGKPLQGRYGEAKGKTTDDILRNSDCNVRVFAPELAAMLDSEANSRFFQFGTDWKWLGGATDLGTKVWRVQFTDANAFPKSWETWITQETPHRFTRIIMTGPSDMGIGTLDDAGVGHNDKTYKTTERIELRFTKYDTQTPIPPGVFERPTGNFKESSFAENNWPLRAGVTAPLPALANVDGDDVPFSKPAAPIVLEFWFAESEASMVWTPRVKALTDEFAKQGVKLYGINGTDSADQIKQVEAKQGWKHMITLLDPEQTYQKSNSVTGIPAVVVIGTDGTFLYREFLGDAAAMGRLKEVLRKATTAAPAPPEPTASPP